MSDEQSEYETSEEEEETESESSEEDCSKEDDEAEAKHRDVPVATKDIPPKEEKVGPRNFSTKPPQILENQQERLPHLTKKTGEVVRQNAQGQRRMTEERKLNLKSLMLSKAREDLKVEAEHKAEEKKRVLSSRIEALPDLNSMSESDLKDFCRELHAKIDKVDEQRYDFELKVKKNDSEIEDLNQRIFDLRGKFKRPPLRRVRMSADQMLRALLGSKHKVSMDLRSNLKSVKKEEGKKEEAKDWRENVEAKQGMSGKKAMFEQASAEGEEQE